MTTGYGLDLWALDGLSTGRYVSGTRLLAQALYRRLITPRGTLRGSEEDGDYGVDVTGYLGAMASADAVAAIPIVVRAELLKDDRVQDVDVTASALTETNGRATVTLRIDVTPIADFEAFSLTLGVSEAGVDVIGGLP